MTFNGKVEENEKALQTVKKISEIVVSRESRKTKHLFLVVLFQTEVKKIRSSALGKQISVHLLHLEIKKLHSFSFISASFCDIYIYSHNWPFYVESLFLSLSFYQLKK